MSIKLLCIVECFRWAFMGLTDGTFLEYQMTVFSSICLAVKVTMVIRFIICSRQLIRFLSNTDEKLQGLAS